MGPKTLKLNKFQVLARDFFYEELFVRLGVDMTDNDPDYNQKKYQAQTLPDFHIWPCSFLDFVLIS